MRGIPQAVAIASGGSEVDRFSIVRSDATPPSRPGGVRAIRPEPAQA